jgi:imidazolonepropionase
MWDRLLTDCHVLTMIPRAGDPLGTIRNAAVGIHEGRIVRVGRRTELAGTRAAEVVPLGGAFVTPGLIDCHTHLVFGGTRAAEHALRRAGATYEDIARAGGGIASTVAATAAASVTELLEQSRRRLHALMRGGVTTVEVKSGYGLDPASELRLLNVIRTLGRSEAVRVVPTLLALHALPLGADRQAYVAQVVDELLPTVARLQLATSVDAFCETIAFTPAETERLFEAASALGLPVRLHAEQLSNSEGAALAARFGALSADHLEHLDVPQLAMHLACTLFGLTPAEAIAGMTVHAARALGLGEELGTLQPGKAADLAVWRVDDPAELGYWLGLMPERRIVGGRDA